MKERCSQQHAPAQAIARVYMGLDEKDKVFERLEKAHEERIQLWAIKAAPLWDPLRKEPDSRNSSSV